MILYFDCSCGIAGNMIIASLLDLGLDWQLFKSELDKLKLKGYTLQLEETERAGIRAKHFKVEVISERNSKAHHPNRSLSDIKMIIEDSNLEEKVKKQAIDIFERLAEVEAHIHNTDKEKIHFHEVGAIDSIIDIVGSAICLHMLRANKIFYSPVAVGSGKITCTHGTLPVPAPATAKLLEGRLIHQLPVNTELSTPTGAAIITTLGKQLPLLPPMELIKVGYGAGSKQIETMPNILRCFYGRDITHKLPYLNDRIVEIKFNIDDMTGEQLGDFLEKISSQDSTLDVSVNPIYTKKNRPAYKVEVLCGEENIYKTAELIFKYSSTLGIRFDYKSRLKLNRKIIKVNINGSELPVKIGYVKDKILQIKPEFEDIKRLAELTGRKLEQLQAEAITEAIKLIKTDTLQP